METPAESGVADSVWRRWESTKTDGEYVVNEKNVWDDSHEYYFRFLSPLGRGVSGSVFVVQIIDCPKHPQIKNFIFSLKIFKILDSAIAQGENEMLILPLCHRSFNTSKIATFPTYLASLKIAGHLSFLMELGGPNLLHALVMRKNRGLPLPIVKQILTKLLTALSEMENKGLVHADIKPENILFSFRKYGQMKSFSEYSSNLASFGQGLMRDDYESISNGSIDVMLIDWSSSSIGYNQTAPYIQSRYYRAPEIIMRSSYGPGIDVWSTACVAVELFIGKPLFPGNDEIEMLKLIQQRLGIFPQSVTRKMGEDSVARRDNSWKMNPAQYSPGNFEAFIREESKREDVEVLLFINIMRLMLQLNPDARTTASSALLHPFITGNMRMKYSRRRMESVESSSDIPIMRVRRKSVKENAPMNL